MSEVGKIRKGRKCEGCGARVRTEARFCEYCGAELPREVAPKPAASPSHFGDVEARFDALKEHPGTARLLRRTPSGSRAMGGMIAGIVFGLVFAGFAVFFISMTSSMERDHREFRTKHFPNGMPFPGEESSPDLDTGPDFSLFHVIPVIFILVGVGIAGWSLYRLVKFSSSPLERPPALVTGERTRVSGGGNNSRASTSYYVSLQLESGRRREFRTHGRVIGEVTAGDMGIAYVKGRHLLDFERVPV